MNCSPSYYINTSCGPTTWGNLNVPMRVEKDYTSPAELQKQERAAVARRCRCGKCYCCVEQKLGTAVQGPWELWR